MSSSKKFIALLRGINVGGNKKVPMADLKKMLEKMGRKNVKTFLASGNVLFESAEKNIPTLTKKISDQLQKTFGFPVPVIIRSHEQLTALIKSDPFKKIAVTPATRLYVTFLGDKPKSTLKIPYVAPGKDFAILRVTDNEVISVLTVTPDMRTVDSMAILEKEFGKNVTTRNWNTIVKIMR